VTLLSKFIWRDQLVTLKHGQGQELRLQRILTAGSAKPDTRCGRRDFDAGHQPQRGQGRRVFPARQMTQVTFTFSTRATVAHADQPPRFVPSFTHWQRPSRMLPVA
jgi:hypothetical protein